MKIATLPLRQAVKLVSAAVAKKTLVPIFEGVRFAEGYATASDGDISVSVPVSVKLPACVLEYATLSAALAQLTDDEIGFELGDVAAQLKAGRTRIAVPVLGQPADFPAMQADASAPAVTFDRAVIERVADLAGFATPDNLRPSMAGIYYDGADFVTTDGHTLANYHIGGDKVKPCVLPTRLFYVLRGFARATDYAFEAGRVRVLRDNEVLAEVRFRCIDERYPEWQNVVPLLHNHAVAEFEREEMVDAIDVLNIVTSKATPEAAFLIAAGGGITATATNLEFNKDVQTAVAADVKRLPQSVALNFNTVYLERALKYVGGEVIKGYFSEPNRAVVFKNPDFNGFALVMPIFR